MAEEIKSQLIDINGLSTFLSNTDERYVKIGEGTGVTYTLSKNSDGEIVLTGSDSSVTKVSDANTTYGFSQSGTTLTITPSEGDPITINMGEEITSEKIIAALGFTPIQQSDVPTTLASFTDDTTHRLVSDTEKDTWNAKGDYSKPEGGIPKSDLTNAVQTSLGLADSALQEHQDISGKVDKETGKSLISDTEITRLASVDNYDDTAISGRISALEGAGYITKAVEDLTNYYKKTETYTQEEVNALVSAIPKFSIEAVSELPTESISPTTIYLLKTSETETGNLYTEYIYINSTWEKLGTQTLDLSGYQTKLSDTQMSAVNSGITSTKVSTYDGYATTIGNKVDKVSGKGLSTNDLTAALKSNYDAAYTHSQSAHAPSGAQANVIETIKVNNTALTPTSKAVNITVPTSASDIGAYAKPSGGIPKSDLASAVQTSLGKADTALQSHQDISGKQDKNTAVTHSASTAVGSATQPVYVNANGVATVCSYTIGKSVPSDAKFTDTTYSAISDATINALFA